MLVALGLGIAVLADAQCDRLVGPYPFPCGNNTCSVNPYGCAYGYGSCFYVFPGIACPCATSEEYVGTAQNNPAACGELVRPNVKASIRTAAGAARTFVVYLPNCKGSFSIEEVVS